MTCFDCGQPAEHMHHVVPRSMGGTKTIPLCLRCHSLVHSHPGLGSPALIKAGIVKARARGVVIGRPIARDDIAILKLRATGLSIRKIAAQLGITPRSVQPSVEKAKSQA